MIGPNWPIWIVLRLERWRSHETELSFHEYSSTKFPTGVSLNITGSKMHFLLLCLVGTKMDQEPNGQCGQASESQPEVHRPLSHAHPSRGARFWVCLVSNMSGRPCFPKRCSPSGEGVMFMGNSVRVWSKFIFVLDPLSERILGQAYLIHMYEASEENTECDIF